MAAFAQQSSVPNQAAQLIDLPPADLDSALTYLAQRYNIDLVYDPSLIKGLNAPRLGGYMTAREALIEVVKPSGLSIVENQPGSYLVIKPPTADKEPVEASPHQPALVKQKALTAVMDRPLREVVVVGTHLQNEIPVGASISVYDAEDLYLAGGVSLENLGRRMTVNFSGADSLATLNTNGDVGNLRQGAASNVFGGAGFNLLGLGPGATLTLLNGHRLAPAGLDGSITDISLIPLSAIDHIEVLTDGASAVYGSDAVAGVVNIVTRSTLEGAESVGRFGRSTEGGGGQSMAAQLFGHSWATGSALLDLEYTDQEELDASQRDWIPVQTGPYSLEPANIKWSLFVSGNQQLGADTDLSVTGLYSSRAFASDGVAVTADGAPPGIEAARGTVSQADATASLGAPLFGDWTGTASLNYSSTNQRRYGTALPTDLTGSGTVDSLAADFKLASVDLSATGELFRLPGGIARLSAGLATRYETYMGTVPSVTPLPKISQSRAVRSVYGEASLPLVDYSAGLPWAQSIDFSIAYRFDDYNDIGGAGKPKVGWAWVPVQGYKIKGTFGESFEAPLLSQMYAPMTSYTTAFPGQAVRTDALIVEGGTQGLSAEESTSVTIGAEIEPPDLRGFKASLSFFYNRFRDRIQSQNIEAKSLQLQSLLIAHSVDVEDVSEVLPYYDIPGFQRDNVGLGPAGVTVIVDNRFVNSSSTSIAGLLLDNRYRYRLTVGHVDIFASAMYILSERTQSVYWEPSVNVRGTVGEPPDWKAAVGADWQSASFGLEFRVNSTSGAQNVLTNPYQSVSGWTTADTAFHYDWPDDVNLLLRRVTVGLSIQNVFDRRPPLVQIPTADAAIGRPTIPYDGTNSSAVGRFIELSIKKRW